MKPLFSTPRKSRAGTTRHPSLRVFQPTAQPDISYIPSDGSYITTPKGTTVRCVHEPELTTTPLPEGVTEITVRQGEGVAVLHTKARPSEVMERAAKHFGTPDRK